MRDICGVLINNKYLFSDKKECIFVCVGADYYTYIYIIYLFENISFRILRTELFIPTNWKRIYFPAVFWLRKCILFFMQDIFELIMDNLFMGCNQYFWSIHTRTTKEDIENENR